MQSCLGLYIEKNLIKYAKVSKDRDNIKIDSFGVKFYEDIKQAIFQIIQETNSTKLPISVNSPEAQYDYFNYFALLNKNALKKSIDIDFDMLCAERGIDVNNIERRYIFTLNPDDVEQMKAINVSIPKAEIENEKKLFGKDELTNIVPLPIGITNLIKLDEKNNELIINLEDKTTLTFLRKGKIESIQSINTSISKAFEQISKIENSETKAYEILKNTTITSQEFDMIQEGNEYLDEIVPVLFKMLDEIKAKIIEFGKPIQKIYLSGTGVIINNIDMYFQDKLDCMQCEIIKPSFLESQSLKIGIKDYIEVNSATSLALSGLNIGYANELNFGAKNVFKVVKEDPKTVNKPVKVKTLKESSGEKFDAYEKMIIRLFAVFIIFFVCYTVVTNKLYDNMADKAGKAQAKINETNNSINKMSQTRETIEDFSKEYTKAIARMNNESLVTYDNAFRSTELQNFLSNLKTIIPRETKLVSLENTEDRHFVIQARAYKYQQLGYLKALLETPTQSGSVQKPILENVKASTGVRYHDEETEEEYILITIEGDLPE